MSDPPGADTHEDESGTEVDPQLIPLKCPVAARRLIADNLVKRRSYLRKARLQLRLHACGCRSLGDVPDRGWASTCCLGAGDQGRAGTCHVGRWQSMACFVD